MRIRSPALARSSRSDSLAFASKILTIVMTNILTDFETEIHFRRVGDGGGMPGAGAVNV
jgi:hypothetical protein